jgi:hypothetical protein
MPARLAAGLRLDSTLSLDKRPDKTGQLEKGNSPRKLWVPRILPGLPEEFRPQLFKNGTKIVLFL